MDPVERFSLAKTTLKRGGVDEDVVVSETDSTEVTSKTKPSSKARTSVSSLNEITYKLLQYIRNHKFL